MRLDDGSYSLWDRKEVDINGLSEHHSRLKRMLQGFRGRSRNTTFLPRGRQTNGRMKTAVPSPQISVVVTGSKLTVGILPHCGNVKTTH